jgi:transketolase
MCIRISLYLASDTNFPQKFEFTPAGISKRAIATIDFYKGHSVRSPINRAFQQIL